MSNRKGIMLCYPFEERRLAKWKPPYIIQPKLDGDRCRLLLVDGRVLLLSSEENPIESVPHIWHAAHKLSSLPSTPVTELDGELYLHGAPHSEIHSIVSRGAGNLHPDYPLMELHLFDLVSSLPQVERLSQLLTVLPERRTGINYAFPIKLVPARIVSTLSEIMAAYDDYIAKGYEGFVLREASAPYVRKRSTSLMKFKPRKEDYYEIIGTREEISIEGVPKGTLGALVCKGEDETEFHVGSGSLLTHEGRKTLWERREEIVGKFARVKYQHMTSARGVPRFPVVADIVEEDGDKSYGTNCTKGGMR